MPATCKETAHHVRSSYEDRVGPCDVVEGHMLLKYNTCIVAHVSSTCRYHMYVHMLCICDVVVVMNFLCTVDAPLCICGQCMYTLGIVYVVIICHTLLYWLRYCLCVCCTVYVHVMYFVCTYDVLMHNRNYQTVDSSHSTHTTT
jgi:hypothetical protein